MFGFEKKITREIDEKHDKFDVLFWYKKMEKC
jgi:hypothetical protein